MIIDVYTSKGTIIKKQLNIPNGYILSGMVVSSRIQTSNIEQSTYNTADTPISYSYTASGLIRVSSLLDTGGAGRCIDILYECLKD